VIRTIREGGQIVVKLEDLATLRTLLTDDLFSHLLRVALWVDRLFVLIMSWKAMEATGEKWTPDQSVIKIDKLTLLYFMCGVVREMSRALRDVEAAGIEGLLMGEGLCRLDQARELMKRWDSNTQYVLVRDKAGFHLDADLLLAGIETFQRAGNTHTLLAGASRSRRDSRFVFAHDAILKGLFVGQDPKSEASAFFNQVASDCLIIDEVVEVLLVKAFEGCRDGRKPSSTRMDPQTRPIGPKEKLESALQAVARLVKRYGMKLDRNLPLHEQIDRINEELVDQRRQRVALERRLRGLTGSAQEAPGLGSAGPKRGQG
jgi:hypothetical protein